ncbi:RNA polymerase sigma factor [Tsukamurella strandjordii]|uniref:RNA polymerase sigma factor n=1 Tax=Tsukamurella TaxID=2060 RepID=UPI001C7D9D8C|nr:RNA polymerase sigma factor [Tsukamurella sp. TY48]GIZ97386.1 putative RNA polymerase sigma factor [Tsukamurella sp. TY48]
MNDPELLSSLSDETLTRRAQRGDAAAFDALVQRHAPALFRFVARTFPQRTDCDDVVQESLIAAWKALPTFAFRSSVRTWLFSIASRKTVDVLRCRHAVVVSDMVQDVATTDPGPVELAADSDFLGALSRELARLPYPSRAAWWLREVDGLSTAEIAAVLRTTEGSVRGHLQRTRRHLAEALEGYRP